MPSFLQFTNAPPALSGAPWMSSFFSPTPSMKNTSCGWACLQSCKWGWVDSFAQLRRHSWWMVSWWLVLWSHSRKVPLASSLRWVSKESHVVLFHQTWPKSESPSAVWAQRTWFTGVSAVSQCVSLHTCNHLLETFLCHSVFRLRARHLSPMTTVSH